MTKINRPRRWRIIVSLVNKGQCNYRIWNDGINRACPVLPYMSYGNDGWLGFFYNELRDKKIIRRYRNHYFKQKKDYWHVIHDKTWRSPPNIALQKYNNEQQINKDLN